VSRSILLLVVLLTPLPAWAQGDTVIKFDGSMGPEGELMPNPAGDFDILDSDGRYDNPDPARANSLFHSFEIFELQGGDTATFFADATPNYVIVRVSGGDGTVVDGTLASRVVNGIGEGADLVWIDPHGIKFGEHAQLDVPGSAHFGTAHELKFEDGSILEAVPASLDPVPHALLTSAAPSAFGFTDGELNLLRVDRALGLRVPEGEIFQLVGGDDAGPQGGVEITSGSGIVNQANIRAPGASVQLASAAGPLYLPLDLRGFDPDSAPPGSLGAVSIDNLGLIDVSSAGGGPVGQVVIRGGQFGLSGGSELRAINESGHPALDPSIDIAVTGAVEIQGGSGFKDTRIRTWTDSGRAGDVLIKGDTIEIRGQGTSVQSLSSSANAGIEGPTLDFRARIVTVSGGAQILSRNAGAGPGGAIAIDADRVEVGSGGEIIAVALGSGAVGPVSITATDSINPTNSIIDLSGPGLSGFGTIASLALGAGPGTLIKLEADTIQVTDGAQVLSEASGPEKGSDIELRATTVRVAGVADGSDPLVRSTVRARAGESATGAGGTVSIAAQLVEVSNGALVTSDTLGAANAGGVSIGGLDAAEGSRAQLVRVDAGLNSFSLISSSTGSPEPDPQDVGMGGDLTVATDRLELLNGGSLTVSTVGLGDAGSIVVDARVIEISGVNDEGQNESGIFARSNNSVDPLAGSAGNIEIWADEQLSIGDRGRISVSTRGTGGAGNILIDVGGAVILSDAASIEARPEVPGATGAAGEIEILAGDKVRLTGGSRVTARSNGTSDAGAISIVAGRRFEAIGSEVTTAADFASGGQISITASELVYLLDSVISTDVAVGTGGGGDVMIGSETIVPEFVVLNEGGIGASAQVGAGGRIDIETGTFFASAPFAINPGRPFPTRGSFLDATSEISGLTGTVNVEPPETELVTELASLSASFLDASALLGSSCEARTSRAGSFQVQRYAASLSPPDASLSPVGFSLQVPGVSGPAVGLPRCRPQEVTP